MRTGQLDTGRVVTKSEPVPALQIDGLMLRFGGVKVFEDVSFAVASGATLGVVGPNGAGKTSLLNCATGAYTPQAGTIRIFGSEVIDAGPAKIARLGVTRTFQGIQLVPDFSVVENILVGCHLRLQHNLLQALVYVGPSRRQEVLARQRVAEILETVGLSGMGHLKASELSHGDQRRVEIGRALASDPRLLFLDEPTSGMSRSERRAIGDLLENLQRDVGITLVLIEHDVDFVRRMCDQVIVLDFGKIIAHGAPDQVFNDPRVIEAYVGA